MASKPTDDTSWALSAESSDVVEPTSKRAGGWQPGDKPPAEWLNWWKRAVHRWIAYAEDVTDEILAAATALTTRVTNLETTNKLYALSNWLNRAAPSSATVVKVWYLNSRYFACISGTTIWSSTDGITWTSAALGLSSGSNSSMTYGNGKWVVQGTGDTTNLAYSTNGTSWTTAAHNLGQTPAGAGKMVGSGGLAYGTISGNPMYVSVGANGALSTSADAITWAARTSGFGTDEIQAVAYGNGTFVAVGGVAPNTSSRICSSTDGISWTSRTTNHGNVYITFVIYSNSVFMSASNNETVTYSSNGITWTAGTGLSAGSSQANDLVNLTGNYWIYVSNLTSPAKIYVSTNNGVSWASKTVWPESGVELCAAAYGNGYAVLVGDNGAVNISGDSGVTWSRRVPIGGAGGTTDLDTVLFDGGSFVVGGDSGFLSSTYPIT